MTPISRTFVAADGGTNSHGNRSITKNKVHLKHLIFFSFCLVLFESVGTEQ